MRTTKKQKIDEYHTLTDRVSLHQAYFWDREKDIKPDANVRYEGHRVTVYAVMGAAGGYVVYTPPGGYPTLHWWERWSDVITKLPSHSNDTLNLKIAAERAGIAVRRVQSGTSK